MKTIAWDVDDVLNDLMKTWLESKWIPEHEGCAVSFDDITENPPHRLLGSDIREYLKSLDEFRLSGEYDRLLPVPEIKKWFVEKGGGYRHIALTAVPASAAHVSACWVMKHFGPWIRTYHYVPSAREGEDIPAYDSDKGMFLEWVAKVDVLVDDSEKNLESAGMAGVRGIAVPRPWNMAAGTIADALRELEEALQE